jgi:O-antigen/teichoic acid export membrane protein
LRRIAFLAGAPLALVWLPAMAARRGFGAAETLLASAAGLASVWFQLDTSVRVTDLRLRNHYGRAYAAEVAAALLRAALAVGMLLTGWLFGWMAVLSTAAGAALGRATAARGDARTPAAAALGPLRRQILRYLAPTLPSALYFAIQAPLTVWLAASFGTTRVVAEVGAQGRLGLVVGLFSGLVGVVFLPRLAATPDERAYRLRYLRYGALLLLLAAGLFAAAALFPRLFLLLLGPHYSGLHAELLLLVATAGVNLLGAYLVGVNNARSWTRWQAAATGVLVLAQLGLLAWLPLDTTSGVLLFNLIGSLVAAGTQVPVALLGFLRPGWVQWR